jgi:cobalt-zinc-cadmium efflux system outer membrane protein
MRDLTVHLPRPFIRAPLLYLMLLASARAEQTVINRFDLLIRDRGISLQEIIRTTLARYPQTAIVSTKEEQTAALRRRGDSLLAGTPSFWAIYGNDRLFDNTGQNYIETQLQRPLWNWEQQAAGQTLAEEAGKDTRAYAEALKLQVAGLVRDALWDLRLTENRYDLAREALKLSDRLLRTVERRFEAGDLPHADLLLAEERAHLSKQHLKMSRSGFEAGEIQLIHLLKIESRTEQAIHNAQERSIQLRRDIARYNQAVGELP